MTRALPVAWPTKLELIALGNPVLRERARRISMRELASPACQSFARALGELLVASGGLGIAAPQVGVSRRLIAVHIDPHHPRYPGHAALPLTVLVNPRIDRVAGRKIQGWEGDLSVDLRAKVPRHPECRVSALTLEGEPITLEITDPFRARVFQHEIDHLDGVMFVDRVTDTRSYAVTSEWDKRHGRRS